MNYYGNWRLYCMCKMSYSGFCDCIDYGLSPINTMVLMKGNPLDNALIELIEKYEYNNEDVLIEKYEYIVPLNFFKSITVKFLNKKL